MEQDIKKLQGQLLEILKMVDHICRQNNIPYSLYGGTLLGAVRHKGFIPWDDDVDICMTRKNYARFIEAWENQPVDGFILQYKGNTPAYNKIYAKIRKDHTTFLEYREQANVYHTGIFIDIFPIDYLPKNIFKRIGFYWTIFHYLLLTKEKIRYKKNKIFNFLNNWIAKKTEEEKQKKYRIAENKLLGYQKLKSKELVVLGGPKLICHRFPLNLMDHFVELPFEGEQFMCVKEWDTMLHLYYGDYMQLPPEEKRVWVHHPLILDYDRNYDELDDILS